MSDHNPWKQKKLGDHAYIKGRIGWRGLTSDEYTEDGPYLIAGNHIIGGRIDWAACDHISMHRYSESWEIALQEDDVILTKDGTIGRVAIIDYLPGLATINSTMMLVRVRSPLVSEYVYHYLNSEAFHKLVEERVSGSSVPHIFQRDMSELMISVPGECEQRRIAAILDTVDAAIQRTDALIAKLKQIKTGLLLDLLTRGLDEDGELRDPVAHPEQFKESAVGRIPREWDTTTLEAVITEGPQNGLYRPSSDYGYDGTRIVRIDGFYDGVLADQSTFQRVRLQENEIGRYRLSINDILINRVNSIGFVGKSAIVPDPEESTVFESNIMRLRVDSNRLLPDYAIRLLTSYLIQRQFHRQTKNAIAQASINQEDVKACFIAFPSLKEQSQITSILTEHETRLRTEETYRDKLELLKRGLMDDLLAGHVRTIDLPEALFS